MNNYVITLARGFGSGGKYVASELAKRLGIHCYENRILTLASQLSGLDERVFVDIDERLRPTKAAELMARLPRMRRFIPQNERFVSDDKLFAYQKEIILNLAQNESCVIVEKCADSILRDFSHVMSVYIEAPKSYCARRIMEEMNVNEETANRSIRETNKYRADYYKHYTHGRDWTDSVNYDLTLNTERLGIDHCVDIIQNSLHIKYSDLQLVRNNVVPLKNREVSV